MGITEPNAGSDLSCLETTAKRKRDVFNLNGSKTYTSFGNICDFIFVLAYTNKDLGTRNGMTLFIVKTGTKGLKVGPEEQKLGLRGMPLVSLTFDNLELEKEKERHAQNKCDNINRYREQADQLCQYNEHGQFVEMTEEFDRSDVAIDEHNQYESEMKFALSTKLMED